MPERSLVVPRAYRCGEVTIDCARFAILRAGRVEKITPRAFEVLLYLIEHRNRVIEKQELFDQIWKVSFVSDNALTRMIKEIRQVLGDDADAPRYIETVHRRGYRFIAQLQEEELQHTAPRIGIHSIAVLPFTNLSGDPDSEYLSDGIAESIINLLSSLPSLKVAPRGSAFRFRGRQEAVIEAGQMLGVRAILTGRVLHHGPMLIVKTELIDVAEERQLWGEQYQLAFSDIFTLQGEIARDISKQLQVKLTGEEQQRLTSRYGKNIEAYRLYLKGRYFWAKRPDGLDKAVKYFQQALELEPSCALPWAGLADCYSTLGSWEDGSLPPREVMPKALAAAQKALEMNPELAEAYASLAYIKTHYDWDWRGAEQDCLEAMRLNPELAGAYHWYSHLLVSQSRFTESLAACQKCLTLDHLDVIHNTHLGWHYYHARQYDAALSQYQKTLELDPHSIWPLTESGRTYEQQQKYDDAIDAITQAVRSTRSSFPVAALGHAYAIAGRRAEALQQLEELSARAAQGYVTAFSQAIVYVGLGEYEQALDWMEKAYEERCGWMTYLKVDPRLDPLRNNPRFRSLLQRVGLN